jgi:hypothetical protein
MSHLFYRLRNLPPNMYREPGMSGGGSTECFKHALPEWRKLGLGAIVDRVDGNGLVHKLDDGWFRLCVWPAGQEFTLPAWDEEIHPIDEDLYVSWCGPQQPGPADLCNGNPLRLSTVPLILADGEVWQIPEIREPAGTRLPTDLIRDRKTGGLLTPVKREYQQLWEETEFWFDLKWKALSGEAKTFNLGRALQFATQILSLRYRFCDATQAALRVIDSVNVEQIIDIAISWPEVLQRVQALIDEQSDDQKKSVDRSAVNVSGSSGVEASGQVTGRLEENNGSPPLATNG